MTLILIILTIAFLAVAVLEAYQTNQARKAWEYKQEHKRQNNNQK